MTENYKIPQHVAIIMDGNGRWATEKGLPRSEGHKAGAERIGTLLDCAKKLKIPFITVYAFSTENWKRPQAEVDALMMLLNKFLNSCLDKLQKENIRLCISGRTEELAPHLQKKITEVTNATRNNNALTFTIALNYGGRSEIADAAKKIAAKIKSGELSVENVDEKIFAEHLYHPELPDVDLLIRTGGEMRVSNFLLWEISYAEFFVTDTYWPDFNEKKLIEALDAYNKRDRRLGGLNK